MSIDLIQKTFSALKHRNFRLFFVGQTVSVIGTWIHQTALSWLIYDITGSKYMLGIIAALTSLPMLFLPILGGAIADRFPKKNIVILTQFSSMVLAAALAVIVVGGKYDIRDIVVISALLGVAFAIDVPVRHSFLAEIAGKEDLMNAIALNSSMFNLARVIGPAIAGIIMLKFGVPWCFIINAISFLAVLIALFYIQANDIPIAKLTEPIGQYTLGGFRYVRQNKVILNVMILMIMMGIFGWSFGILLPAFAKDVFSQGEQGYAMMVSANGLGALLGALYIAYNGNAGNKRQLIDWGVYLFSAMLLLLAFCKSYLLSLILLLGAGMGLLIYFSSSTTVIQSSVEDSFRGRVMGVWALIFGGTVPVGALFVGMFSQQFGISATLLLCASLCPLFTIALSLKIHEPEIEKQKELVKI